MSEERYTAGRDLYEGKDVRFAEGDPVPAGAFPPAAERSLRANGGLLAFRAKSSGAKELITAVPEVGQVLPLAAPFDPRGHNVPGARELIQAVEDPAVLDALEAIERTHTKHEGGRTKVLQAVEAQRQRLLPAVDPVAEQSPAEDVDG